jgi:uncharacterized protein
MTLCDASALIALINARDMAQYRDIPMDLGDASLVVAAETLQQAVIFTLDRDFYIYRLPNNRSFQVVPGRD